MMEQLGTHVRLLVTIVFALATACVLLLVAGNATTQAQSALQNTAQDATQDNVLPSSSAALTLTIPEVDNMLQVSTTISVADASKLADCLYDMVTRTGNGAKISLREDEIAVANTSVQPSPPLRLALAFAPAQNLPQWYPLFQGVIDALLKQRLLCASLDSIAAFVPERSGNYFQPVDPNGFSSTFMDVYNRTGLFFDPENFTAVSFYQATRDLVRKFPVCEPDVSCQLVLMSDGEFSQLSPEQAQNLIDEAGARGYTIATILLGADDSVRAGKLKIGQNSYLGAVADAAQAANLFTRGAWADLQRARSSVTLSYPLLSPNPHSLTVTTVKRPNGPPEESADQPFRPLNLKSPLMQIITAAVVTRTQSMLDTVVQAEPLTVPVWLDVTWPDGRRRPITQGSYAWAGQVFPLLSSPLTLTVAELPPGIYPLTVTVTDSVGLPAVGMHEIRLTNGQANLGASLSDGFTLRALVVWQSLPAWFAEGATGLAKNNRALFVFTSLLLPLIALGSLAGAVDWWLLRKRSPKPDVTNAALNPPPPSMPFDQGNVGQKNAVGEETRTPTDSDPTNLTVIQDGLAAWQRRPMAYLVPISQRPEDLFVSGKNDYTDECLRLGMIPIYHPDWTERIPVRIGFRPNANPALSPNVFLHRETRVSGLHATIDWQHENSKYRLRIRDQGARNGTFVNTKRLTVKDEPLLEEGHEVVLGNLFFTVRYASSTHTPAPPQETDEGNITQTLDRSPMEEESNLEIDNVYSRVKTNTSFLDVATLRQDGALRRVSVKRARQKEYNALIDNEAHWLTQIHIDGSSPGIIQLIPHPNAESEGLRFLVLEYLEGDTLAAMMKEPPKLRTSLTVQIAVQLAVALQRVHACGCAHLDLQPSNVMFRRVVNLDSGVLDGDVVLIDFGISDGFGETYRLNRTADWVAPERQQAEDSAAQKRPITLTVQPSMDIYSLGQLIFFMLTKEVPKHDDMLEWILTLERNVQSQQKAKLYTLLRDMLDVDPQRRPNAARVVQQLKVIQQSILS